MERLIFSVPFSRAMRVASKRQHTKRSTAYFTTLAVATTGLAHPPAATQSFQLATNSPK
jgi:hypothetical protein